MNISFSFLSAYVHQFNQMPKKGVTKTIKSKKAEKKSAKVLVSKKPKELNVKIGSLKLGHPSTPYVINLRDIHLKRQIDQVHKEHTPLRKTIKALQSIKIEIAKLKRIPEAIKNLNLYKPSEPEIFQDSRINVYQRPVTVKKTFSTYKRAFSYIAKGFSITFGLIKDILFFISVLPKELLRVTRLSQLKPLFTSFKSKHSEKIKFASQRMKFQNLGYKKTAITFAAMSLALIIPLETVNYYSEINLTKDNIINSAMQAVSYLKEGKDLAGKSQLALSAEQFSAAAESFSKAQQEVDSINSILQKAAGFVPQQGEKLESGKKLIILGESISKAAQYLDQTAEVFSNQDSKIIEKAVFSEQSLSLALEQLNLAAENSTSIDISIIPEDYRDDLNMLLTSLPLVRDSVGELLSFNQGALEFLGQNNFRRYLVVFQNNYELRPTGGFMGSFALVDISNGEITNIEIPKGGSYDIAGQQKENVVPPDALQFVSDKWGFQDANWYFDFPSSAKKIMDFYEEGGGRTVDGVIAVNATVLGELLKATGPVKMAAYNKTIDENNYMAEIQKTVELETDKSESKKMIGDLFAELMDRVKNFDKSKQMDLIKIANDILDQKEIQLYFSNQNLELLAGRYKWDGSITHTDSDYLAIVNTNLKGAKSDGVIENTALRKVSVLPDGSIKVALNIYRKNNGQENNIFFGQKNYDYLRIYVPQGSQLISAQGFEKPLDKEYKKFEMAGYKEDEMVKQEESQKKFDATSGTEIYNESGKTVFANWMQTSPGETSMAKIEYVLPFKLTVEQTNSLMDKLFNFFNLKDQSVDYQFLLQKQSGVDMQFDQIIEFPSNYNLIWADQDKYNSINNDSVVSETQVDKDQSYNLLFEVK